jgi:hypothetical protein
VGRSLGNDAGQTFLRGDHSRRAPAHYAALSFAGRPIVLPSPLSDAGPEKVTLRLAAPTSEVLLDSLPDMM